MICRRDPTRGGLNPNHHKGVGRLKRRRSGSQEGSTPSLGDRVSSQRQVPLPLPYFDLKTVTSFVTPGEL